MKFIIVALMVTSAHALTYPLDACRVREGNEKVHCQHFRPRGKYEKVRSKKTVDGWVAVPCRQLKKHIPELDCSPRMGFVKLGEGAN